MSASPDTQFLHEDNAAFMLSRPARPLRPAPRGLDADAEPVGQE